MSKIAFIGPLPPPLGGVAVINQSFQEIDYSCYEVTYFNTSNQNSRENKYNRFTWNSIFKKLRKSKTTERFIEKVNPDIINKRFPWNSFFRELRKSKAIKRFIEKVNPDVINIFVTSGPAILRDLLYLKTIHKYNIPVVIHFHSKIKGEFALTPFRLKVTGYFFKKYAKKIILLSDEHFTFFSKKIILLSDEHFTFFSHYFGEKRCVVIENFVTYSDYDNEIEKKCSQFLFVGRLTKEKGFLDLLNAAIILKEGGIKCEFHIIGLAATEQQEKEVMDFIDNNQLREYIIVYGAVFGKDKLELFKVSKYFIFPSHFENSPVVLKEAIAAKMAIIASNIQANKNILKTRKNNILFEMGNCYDLVEKIVLLLNDKEKSQAMCAESARISEYDVSIAKKKIQAVFDELITKNA
jgi:glycosyltransferase involved in cell wall biosynthesis